MNGTCFKRNPVDLLTLILPKIVPSAAFIEENGVNGLKG